MTQPQAQYDAAYYRAYTGIGEHLEYDRSEHWLTFFGGVGDQIVRRLSPRTVLDAGCAIGLLVEALVQRGVDARGIDVSEYAVSQVPDVLSGRVSVGSVTEPIEGSFDLVTCIEVIEHIPPSQLGAAVANLTAVTDTLLLSTTPEHWEEPTHVNVQPPEYWASLLAEYGFHRDHDFDGSFLTPWTVLFRRSDPDTPKLVRGYERERWRLVQERDALRDAALSRGPGLDAVPQGSGAHQTTIDDLRRQLRDAIDAAHGADARRANVESRLQHVEYALSAAEAREAEAAEMIEQIYDVAEGDIDRLDALLNARTYRAYQRLLSPYRWLRDRTR